MSAFLRRSFMLLSLAGIPIFAGAQEIQVSVNGRPVQFEGIQPQEMNGRVMVPLRGVLDGLGAQFSWDSSSRTVIATRGSRSIRLPLASSTVEVDGRMFPLDTPAIMLDGKVMVPLRFVAQSFGGAVTWDPAARQVRITTEVEPEQPPARTASRVPARPFIRIRTAPARRTGRASTIPLTSSLAFMQENAVIPVNLDTPLSSRMVRPGDPVSATVEFGLFDSRLPRGTRFRGAVREVVPATQGRSAAISVYFTEILFPDGTRQQVSGFPQPLDLRSVRSDGGQLVARENRSRRSMFVGSGSNVRLARADVLPSSLLRVFLEPDAARPGLSDATGGDVNVPSGYRFGVRLDRQVTFDPGQVSEDDEG